MTEYRYLVTFERALPVRIVGLVLTALGRHADPEPQLIIEDGRLVVVQPLVAPGVADQPAGTGVPVAPVPAPSLHPAVTTPAGDSPAVPPPPRASTTSHPVEAGAGGEHECPECGRTFGRLQALGAHRFKAHGVPGVTRRERVVRAAASVDPRIHSSGCKPERGGCVCGLAAATSFHEPSGEVTTSGRQGGVVTVDPAEGKASEDRPGEDSTASHQTSHTPPPNPLVVPPRYGCEHCGARFHSKKQLGVHRAAIHPFRRAS